MAHLEGLPTKPSLVAGFARGPWPAAHAAVAVSLAWLLVLGSYEDRVYEHLVKRALPDDAPTSEQKAEVLLRVVHGLVAPRAEVWGGTVGSPPMRRGFRETWLSSGDSQLLAPTGACGSYTHVLARSLQAAGFEVRIAQMKANGHFGAHILLEARVEEDPQRWVVLDALYPQAFRRADGKLASFADVQAAWATYEDQVPEHYDRNYKYEDVRYTNWSKIPVLMPLARWFLSLVMGKEWTRTLSIRSYVLNIYKTYAFLLCGGYAMTIALALMWWRTRRLRRAPNDSRS